MRPRPPDIGPRKPQALPGTTHFTAFAVAFADRLVLRTPYDAGFVEDIKQIPSKLRAFAKDGRQLENLLRRHLEDNETYFSSNDDLASMVAALVESIAEARGLSDSWVIALAAPELFEWSLAATLKAFPDANLFDVRVLPHA